MFRRELKKRVPQRPTAPKPPPKTGQIVDPANLDDLELAELSAAILALGGDLPEELRSLPSDLTIPRFGHPAVLSRAAASSILRWPGANSGYSTHNPDFLQIYHLLKLLLRSPVFQHLPFLSILVTVFPSLLWHSNSSHSFPKPTGPSTTICVWVLPSIFTEPTRPTSHSSPTFHHYSG